MVNPSSDTNIKTLDYLSSCIVDRGSKKNLRKTTRKASTGSTK